MKTRGGLTWLPYLWEEARPVDPQVVRAAAEALGVTFPESYVGVVSAAQGEIPSLPLFDYEVEGETATAVLNVLFHYVDDPGDEWSEYYIVTANEDLAEEWPAGLVAFAETPEGAPIAFDYRAPGEPAVVMADLGHGDEIVTIAPSFEALLEALYDDDGTVGPGGEGC